MTMTMTMVGFRRHLVRFSLLLLLDAQQQQVLVLVLVPRCIRPVNVPYDCRLLPCLGKRSWMSRSAWAMTVQSPVAWHLTQTQPATCQLKNHPTNLFAAVARRGDAVVVMKRWLDHQRSELESKGLSSRCSAPRLTRSHRWAGNRPWWRVWWPSCLRITFFGLFFFSMCLPLGDTD